MIRKILIREISPGWADPGELLQGWAWATCRGAVKGSRAITEPACPSGKWEWAGKEWSPGISPHEAFSSRWEVLVQQGRNWARSSLAGTLLPVLFIQSSWFPSRGRNVHSVRTLLDTISTKTRKHYSRKTFSPEFLLKYVCMCGREKYVRRTEKCK